MKLPAAAIEKVLRPLRRVSDVPHFSPNSHTIPIDKVTWRKHADALADSINSLRNLLIPPPDSFNELQEWVQLLLVQRDRVGALLLALKPFEPYEPRRAGELLDLLNELPAIISVAVKSNSSFSPEVARTLLNQESWWNARTSSNDGSCLERAFGLESLASVPQRNFRPEAVLRHYAYKNSKLLERLLPHLSSLGVADVTDVLAAIFAVGQVLDCEDSVVAYIAFNAMVRSFLAADATTAKLASEHLQAVEPALRRSQAVVVRAHESMRVHTDDMEARALSIADAYKRTLEGPFRQYSWAMRCLGGDGWGPTPMLSSLKERLVSEGGMLASVANEVVLPEMRNSETHETLVWDGFANEFVTEGSRLDVGRVEKALSVATSFVKGAEAGLATVRSLNIQENARMLPSVEDGGRMPIEDRVRAFFGTNRLELHNARLNSPHARFLLQQLRHRDINPCFQALILARRLLPRTEKFEVSTLASDGPLTVVDAAALEATMPSWEFAVSHLDSMPLATFLPANLDMRLRMEPESVALRSAAWIAVDDAIGAIDGSPENWNESDRALIDTRLQVVEIAVDSIRQTIGKPNTRFESVQESVVELRNWIIRQSPVRAAAAEGRSSMSKLRTQWDRWGPVPRHPLIPEALPNGEIESAPALRSVPAVKDYRII